MLNDVTTRKPRHTAGQRSVLALNCMVVLGCFVGAAALLLGERFVSGQQKSPAVVNLARVASAGLGPTETFPQSDPEAMNFLITGADNNGCVDPASPFAGAFGDRSEAGQRSDTIMIMRVDPVTSQAAVLSFPRDLWIPIHGSDSESRINSAYVKNDPTKLIQTIYDVFGVGIDHFIQVDFCTFKTLVDAVGGVSVPFEFATRDTHTGLNVPTAGCFNLTGDHALAYVRSRHYQYLDPKNSKWTEDGFADLGRISRQQDFLRRVITKALATGVYTPSVARGLINTAQNFVVTDPDLTLQKMLQFAGVIRNLDQSNLRTYQIEADRETRDGNDVMIPRVGGRNMRAILGVFQGKAPLLEAPLPEPQTPVSGPASSPSPTAVVDPPAVDPPAGGLGAEENVKGIVPPRDVVC